MKKSKLAFFLSSAVFISSLAFSVVSCGETITPPDTCEECEKCEECEECPEPEVVTHSVSITENSDCTIAVDKNKAEAGETITVTITGVTEGKMVVSVTCGDTVLAANDSNVYTFAMPEKEVAVSATIEDVPVEAVYSISCPDVEGATIHVDKTEAKMGEKVEVQVVPGEGKRVASVKANDMGVSQDTTGKYSFIMPGANVTITVEVEDIPTPTKHEIEHNNPTGATISVDKTEAAVGEVVEITVEITDSAKRVKSVTAGTQSLAEYLSGRYRFIMPDEYVWIVVELEDIPVPVTYSVNWDAVAGATIEVSKSTGLAPGEEVTVKVAPDQGKTVTSVVAGDMVLGASQTGEYKFAMPAKDVDLVVTVIDTPDETLSVSWATSDDYTIDASATSGLVAGQLVTLSVTLTDSTHVIYAVSANDQPLAKDSNTGRYLLTMPATDVVITVTHHQDENLVPIQLTTADSTSSTDAWQDHFEIIFTTGTYSSMTQVTEALPGTVARMWLVPLTSSPTKQFKSVRLQNTWYYNDDDEYNESAWCHPADKTASYIEFTVNSSFTAVTPNIEDYEYRINYNSSNSSYYTFYNSGSNEKAAEGDTVNVYPVAREGYLIKGLTVATGSYTSSNTLTVTYNSSSNYYTFTMPAAPVYVSAVYEAEKVGIGVITDEHATVSNFRTSSSATPFTTASFGPSTNDSLAVLAGKGTNLYFDVTPDEGYYVASVERVDAEGNTTELSYSRSSGYAYINSVPATGCTIKVTTALRYEAATINVKDSLGAAITEGYTLEVYNDSTGTTLAESNMIDVSSRHQLGFIVKTDTSVTTGAYSIASVSVNGEAISASSLYRAEKSSTGELIRYFWFERSDYAGDSLIIDVTLSFDSYIFDADSEYVGDYIGSLISSSGSRYMRIRRTGSYAYGSSSSNLLNDTGKFAAPVEGSTDLVDSTNARTVVKSGDYAFVLDSTTSMSSNAILVKGATSTPSNSVATIDGEDMHVLFRQTFNGTATYHLVDLTDADNPVVNFDVTVGGTPFTSGNAVTITVGNEVIHAKFSSSSACTTYTPDAYGGTYTVADGSAQDLGSIVLDGAGSATMSNFSGRTYDYTVEGNEVTIYGKDGSTSYAPRMLRKVTMDFGTKTYTANNCTPWDQSQYSRKSFVGDVVVDGTTYQITFENYGDGDIKFHYQAKDSTGALTGSKTGITSGYNTLEEDLTGASPVLGISPKGNNASNYASLVNADTVKMTIGEGDTLILNCANFGNSTFTFSATNVLLALQ